VSINSTHLRFCENMCQFSPNFGLSAVLLIFTHSSIMANMKTEGKQRLSFFLETIRQHNIPWIKWKINTRTGTHASHIWTQIFHILLCLIFRRTHIDCLDSVWIQRKNQHGLIVTLISRSAKAFSKSIHVFTAFMWSLKRKIYWRKYFSEDTAQIDWHQSHLRV
jgi:hypothetical protein